MQTGQHLVQPVLQAPPYRGDAEAQPLADQRMQPLDRRTAIGADDVHVDPVAAFQIGGGEQVLHQLLGIHPVGARHYDDTGRILVIRLIAQVGYQRQLLGLHLRGDLLQHLGPGHLMRQCGDDDIAVIAAPDRAAADRTAPGGVEIQQLAARGDDFRLGGEVRALDMLHQLVQPRPGIIQQAHAGGGHLAQVVRRNIRGHAHRDAGGAVEQQVRQPGRQYCRLLQGAVEVRLPVDRALPQFGQQYLAVASQPRLGIAHGGEGLGIIRRTPVALPVHQRIAVGEGLGHQHHGLVTSRVAVGVIFAEHVAHGTGRFLVLGGGGQAQLAHRVDDAPLYRFESVADMRQGPVHDHVHGVVQVGFFGKRRQGATLNAFQAQIQTVTHVCSLHVGAKSIHYPAG